MTTPFKNVILPVNKGLLWKEWQQNRMYFLAAFLIMSYDPLIKPLGYGIKDLLGADAGRYTLAHALGNINGLFYASYHNTFEQMGMYIVILLGVIILVQERPGSLNYLVSTPVSRTEIITAKFLTGSAAITVIIVVNALLAAIIAVGNASMGAESIGGFWGFMVITFIVAYLVIILLSALVYYIKLGR